MANLKTFQIQGVDYTSLVSSLKVSYTHNYSTQQNAAGNTVVDYINCKRVIEVGFISTTEDSVRGLLAFFDPFSITITFKDPGYVISNGLSSAFCMVDTFAVDYYTIRDGCVMCKPFTVRFIEL